MSLEKVLEEQRKAREAAEHELKKVDAALEQAQVRVNQVTAKKSTILQRLDQQLAALQEQAAHLRS